MSTKELNTSDYQRLLDEALQRQRANQPQGEVKLPAVTTVAVENNYEWSLCPDGQWRLFSAGDYSTTAEIYDGAFRKAGRSETGILNAARQQIETARQQNLHLRRDQLVAALVEAAHHASSQGFLVGTSNWAYCVANHLLQQARSECENTAG